MFHSVRLPSAVLLAQAISDSAFNSKFLQPFFVNDNVMCKNEYKMPSFLGFVGSLPFALFVLSLDILTLFQIMPLVLCSLAAAASW